MTKHTYPATRAASSPAMPPRFTLNDYRSATASWGANCGVVSLACITGTPIDAVRQYIEPEFQSTGHVPRELMGTALTRSGASWKKIGAVWPLYGVVIIGWMGRCESSIPGRIAYSNAAGKAHWICASGEMVFDGWDITHWGWQPRSRWERNVLPALTGCKGFEQFICRIDESISVVQRDIEFEREPTR